MTLTWSRLFQICLRCSWYMYISGTAWIMQHHKYSKDNANMTLTLDILDCNANIGIEHYSRRRVDTDCENDDFETFAAKTRFMRKERNRLDTFRNWPTWTTQRPDRLAEAGFYYTDIGDRVRCPFCHGVLKNWEHWDVPFVEHRKHFPQCPFVQGEDVGNVAIGHDELSTQPVRPSNQTFNLLDFTKEANRLATFSRWPPDLNQTPESLARAGFYHVPCEERMDRVVCAYCHGKLYNWSFEDDPWSEHARCFPDCPYVRLCVNRTVIESFQREAVFRPNDENTSPLAACKHEQDVSCHDDVTSFMASDAVVAVLQMGFSREHVQKVVLKYCKDGKNPRLNVQKLASDVLELEETETLSNTHNATATSVVLPIDNKPVTTTNGALHDPGPDKSETFSTVRRKNSSLKDKYLCKVCMKDQIMVTFLPCGHLACCGHCSLAMSECPVCRTKISGCVRTYF